MGRGGRGRGHPLNTRGSQRLTPFQGDSCPGPLPSVWSVAKGRGAQPRPSPSPSIREALALLPLGHWEVRLSRGQKGERSLDWGNSGPGRLPSPSDVPRQAGFWEPPGACFPENLVDPLLQLP